MYRRQFFTVFNCFDNFIIYDYRILKLFSSVYDSMSYCFDFVQLYSTRFYSLQYFFKCSFIVIEIIFCLSLYVFKFPIQKTVFGSDFFYNSRQNFFQVFFFKKLKFDRWATRVDYKKHICFLMSFRCYSLQPESKIFVLVRFRPQNLLPEWLVLSFQSSNLLWQ